MDKEQLKKAMQNAQEMQVNLLKMQTELAVTDLDVKSPDGKIDIKMSAQGDFKNITLDDSLIAKGKAAIEMSLLDALNHATERAAELTKEKLASISKQIGL